jgi:hypothetical protein
MLWGYRREKPGSEKYHTEAPAGSMIREFVQVL